MSVLARYVSSDPLTHPPGLLSSSSSTPLASAACSRCPASAARGVAAAISRGSPVCAECLVGGLVRRWRDMLAHSPAVGHPAMVAFSGGAGSRLLLSAVRRFMDSGRKRRLFADAWAVHVETSAVWGGEEGGSAAGADNSAALRELAIEAAREGFHLVVVPLEAALRAGCGALTAAECVVLAAPAVAGGAALASGRLPYVDASPHGAEDARVVAAAEACAAALSALRESPAMAAARERLAARLRGAGSSDARQELLRRWTRELCAGAAEAAGARALLTGECADTLALRVLSAVCRGQGAQAPTEAAPLMAWRGEAGRARRGSAEEVARGGKAAQGMACSEEAPGGGGAAASGLVPAAMETMPLVACRSGDAPSGDALSCDPPPVTPLPLPATAPPLLMPPCVWYETHVEPPSPLPLPALTFLRPCGDAEAAEVARACELMGLRVASPESTLSFVRDSSPRTSAEATLARALAGLQRDFASTVHNVVRTVRKLGGDGGGPRIE